VTFDAAEYDARLGRVQARMRSQGLDALVAIDPANMYYLTGYDAWSFYTPQALVVPAQGAPFLFTRNMDVPGVKLTTRLGDEGVVGYTDDYVQRRDRHPFDALASVMSDRGLHQGTLGLERDAYYFTPRAEDALEAGLPGAQLVDSHELVAWVRAIKSTAEVEAMRIAGRIVEQVMRTAIEVIEPGVRQCDAAAEISRAQVRGLDGAGGDYPAIVPLLPSGEGVTTPHLTWSDRPFQVGEPTVLELAGTYRRYHCPMARTVFLGEPPAELLRLADVVAEGTEAALAAASPGATCEAVEEAWRAVISSHGFEKSSRIGYSVGIGYPPDWGEHTMSLRPGDSTVLEPGMTFHMILGMWLDDSGFELSETFHVTPAGAECLTGFPRKLFVK
jgi:ectoine hydrolase